MNYKIMSLHCLIITYELIDKKIAFFID